MLDHPVLGQLSLGYSPMIDRQHQVVATRLTVFPERPDAAPDAAALLRACDEVWPAPETGTAPPRLLLNVAGEALLEAVLAEPAAAHRMIEVPAFMVADPARAARLAALAQGGAVLVLKGRPLAPLAPALLGCFAHSIVDFADDRRDGVAAGSVLCSGARTQAEANVAFGRGATALLGWPFDDTPPPPSSVRSTVPPDLKVVLDLVNGVDRDESPAKLEATLKRDPTLAFRLMRYLNSPAFGLSVEINSFGHALMLLGRQRLKRWLVLLLASSSKDASARPLMYAAVRRGLMLEELVRPQGDSEIGGEMFICGVFSLLDRLLQQPIETLLASVPVPERVQLALRGEGGPHQPFLDLVRAIEAESVFDIRECADRVFLGSAEINLALLTALRAARQLD